MPDSKQLILLRQAWCVVCSHHLCDASFGPKKSIFNYIVPPNKVQYEHLM